MQPHLQLPAWLYSLHQLRLPALLGLPPLLNLLQQLAPRLCHSNRVASCNLGFGLGAFQRSLCLFGQKLTIALALAIPRHDRIAYPRRIRLQVCGLRLERQSRGFTPRPRRAAFDHRPSPPVRRQPFRGKLLELPATFSTSREISVHSIFKPRRTTHALYPYLHPVDLPAACNATCGHFRNLNQPAAPIV
jgi:hypothetical protein